MQVWQLYLHCYNTQYSNGKTQLFSKSYSNKNLIFQTAQFSEEQKVSCILSK